MYLLDTNVVSELRKAEAGANRNVLAWAASVPTKSLYLSAITVLELEIGVLWVERRDPRQGEFLRSWLDRQVLPSFSERVLPVDDATALRWAKLHVPDRRPDRDALIAATALDSLSAPNVDTWVAFRTRPGECASILDRAAYAARLDSLSAPNVDTWVAFRTRPGECASILDRAAYAARLDSLSAPNVDTWVAFRTRPGECASILDRAAYAARLDSLSAPNVDTWVAFRTRPGECVSILDRAAYAARLVHCMTVVTRNIRDFGAMAVATINPWRATR